MLYFDLIFGFKREIAIFVEKIFNTEFNLYLFLVSLSFIATKQIFPLIFQ